MGRRLSPPGAPAIATVTGSPPREVGATLEAATLPSRDRQGWGAGGTPPRAPLPWNPAAPRNSAAASRPRCLPRRPAPCSRRRSARSPPPGGLQRRATRAWESARGARRDGRGRRRSALTHLPEGTRPPGAREPHLGLALASPSSRVRRGRRREGGRRSCGDTWAPGSCIHLHASPGPQTPDTPFSSSLRGREPHWHPSLFSVFWGEQGTPFKPPGSPVRPTKPVWP